MIDKIKNIFSGVISIVVITILIQIEPIKKNNLSDLFTAFVVFIIIFFVVRFLFFLFLTTKKGESLKSYLQDKEMVEKIKKEAYYNILDYEEAKNSFKYFSNERLEVLYNNLKDKGVENMERLALEEILVEKGLLSHSEMHEKLHSIKNK